MASEGERQRGSAAVEQIAVILLVALVLGAVLAVLMVERKHGSTSLASSIAFKQRCAVRHPDPCWQDPLTEAYGRAVAGAVRALAPEPSARIGPGGEALVGVDYRQCRQASCAIPVSERLTRSNRRTTAFTSIRDRRRSDGELFIDYWIYRPTLGWERVTRRLASEEIAAYARTPLTEDANPKLIPLETLLGRDDARFRAGEKPPWQGRVESRWGRR